MNRSAIHQHIDDHIDQHTAHIQNWVRQPSVSWDNMGVDACAEIVASSYRGLDCQEVEIIDGRFHPGVWAYYDAGAPLTIHNYCMFDTRTVQPADWDYDPWGAELVAIDPYPKVLVGRGALGAKGPYVAWLNALSAIIAVEGTLPVNIMFLAEGEEIMGSPTYRDFAQRYADRLQQVDASFCPSCTQNATGGVSIGLGLKGMIVVELTASGKAWGRGPAKTIHSANAALVDSPPFRLAQALATLTNKDGTGCQVKGLEDVWSYRKPLDAEENELLDNLVERTASRDWRDVFPMGGAQNVSHIIGGTDGRDPLINYLYGPTFNIAGMRSGFLGEETGTIPYIIPGEATATLDMRLVIEISPEEVIGHLRQHLDDHGFDDIEIDVFAAFSHAQTSPSHPVVKAARQALEQWNIQEPLIWPIEAGGGPWTVIPNQFNVPCLRGATIGGGNRSPINEFMVIEGDGKIAGLADVEKYLVDLLYGFANIVDEG